MTDIQDVVYCFACRKPMPAAEAACPACGTDQAAARAQRAQVAPPAAKRGRPAPAAPEPRTETVPCPNCKVNVAPTESRCGYCGHMMDDPDAQSRFDTGYSKIYAGIGIFCAVLALIPLWIFPYQGIILAAAAVALGRMAQSENRYDVLGGVSVGMGFGCGLAGYLLRFLLIALAASRT